MKVFFIEMNNGESHEDFQSWVSATFFTYRDASAWLLEEGFAVEPTFNDEEEDLIFSKVHNSEQIQYGYPVSATNAIILDMDVFGSPLQEVVNARDDGWFS